MVSAIYANSVASYLSGKLLGADKLRRLIDSDFSSCVKMLTEYGYNGGNLPAESYDLDGFITVQTKELAEFVKENSPSNELTRCLLNRFYYSDAKVYYKRRFSLTIPSDTLYLDEGETADAFENKDYENLPVEMAAAANALDEKFSDFAPPPRDIDLAFTKASFKDSLVAAKKSKNASLVSYITASIDIANILTAFRARRLNLLSETLTEELIDGGSVSKKRYLSVLEPETKRLTEYFAKTPYFDLVYDLAGTGDFLSFNQKTDELILSVLLKKISGVTGYFPFIKYFISKISEFKAVKLILTCVKNGLRDELNSRIGAYLND